MLFRLMRRRRPGRIDNKFRCGRNYVSPLRAPASRNLRERASSEIAAQEVDSSDAFFTRSRARWVLCLPGGNKLADAAVSLPIAFTLIS